MGWGPEVNAKEKANCAWAFSLSAFRLLVQCDQLPPQDPVTIACSP